MKKFLTIFIVFIMCFTINVNAVVVDDIPESGPLEDTNELDVTAKYVSGVYAPIGEIKFSWGAMEFIYKEPDYDWDYVNKEYVSKNNGGWSSSGGYKNNNITFTNETPLDISVSLQFTPTNGSGVTGGTFSCGNSLIIAKKSGSTATTEEITFMPTGDLIKTTDNDNKYASIGRIIITLD